MLCVSRVGAVSFAIKEVSLSKCGTKALIAMQQCGQDNEMGSSGIAQHADRIGGEAWRRGAGTRAPPRYFSASSARR
jgi:hypothetical protein